MAHFTSDFIHFFEELSGNNSKEWFDQNRKRYEKEVKEPLKALVASLIDHMNEEGAGLALEPKDCILRINRDIRFSKDKTPYNTHVTAFLSKGGRKDKSNPGFGIRLAAEGVWIMIGSYAPDKEQLLSIRRYIAGDPQNFHDILKETAFFDFYGQVRGEQHKRIPPEFREAVTTAPEIANKQFYFMAQLPAALIPDDKLIEELMQAWRLSLPFNQWLSEALNPAQL